ncbi:hypothetical protein B0A79_05035 [Flavobacterium piscis]|uniref:DUF4294 domain-containing protein n=1 Tax=Flavobacterium piscis TaxID=1114874 RepID=A0ABX2XLK5_9FLAO|nr:hypothetical protein [Flavobacterium piscis]OCB76315.1 hypothetical protein FLP_06380 [Flavobacterium piscis]OXG06783.1 hypothetical protein B0A79_05035 [Flavobacterium piscis]
MNDIRNKLNKHLKYLIYVFLAFVVIASDGTSVSQSKAADYYQSSFVISGLEFKKSRLYIFNRSVFLKIAFSFPVNYLEFKQVRSFQIQIIQKLQKLLHQNINSLIRQAVFISEIITSNNFYKGLYSA